MDKEIINEILLENNFIVPYLRQFFKHLSGKDILDIGCLNSYCTNKVYELGFNITGTDNDEEKINMASLNNPNIKYFYSDYLDIQTKKKYDGIILFLTINRISLNNINQFFNNLLKNLKDNGYVLIVIKTDIKEPLFNYSKEYIDTITKEGYLFIEELSSYENLKFYIYAKNTVK